MAFGGRQAAGPGGCSGAGCGGRLYPKYLFCCRQNKKKKGDTSQNCLEIIVSYLRTNTSIENVQKQARTPIFVNFADLCAKQQHNKTGRVCPAWQTRLNLRIRILQIFYYVVFMDGILFPNCCGIFVIFYCRGDRYVLLTVYRGVAGRGFWPAVTLLTDVVCGGVGWS